MNQTVISPKPEPPPRPANALPVPVPLWQLPSAWMAALVGSGVLTAICVAYVDRPFSRLAHDVIGQHDFLFAMQAIPNYLGPLCAIAVVVLGLRRVFGRQPSFRDRVLFAAGLALLVSDTLKDQLKLVFGRTWPETWINNNPSYIGNGVYGFFWFHGGPGWASFPSGHTTLAMAFATVIACAYPKWRSVAALLVAVVVIGLLGMDYHFVGDIVGGLFVGGVVGVATAIIAGLMPSQLEAARSAASGPAIPSGLATPVTIEQAAPGLASSVRAPAFHGQTPPAHLTASQLMPTFTPTASRPIPGTALKDQPGMPVADQPIPGRPLPGQPFPPRR